MFAQSETLLVQNRTEYSWRERLAVQIMAAGAVLTLPWTVALLLAAWRLATTFIGFGLS